MYIMVRQLLALGVSQAEITAMLDCGKWQLYRGNTGSEKAVLLASLPPSLQAKWAMVSQLTPNDGQFTRLLIEAENYRLAERENEIISLLSRLAIEERIAWTRESLRLAKLVERY